MAEVVQLTLAGKKALEADIDAKPKSISNDSPVGAALLGKSIDEITNVEAPGGLMKVKIISIRR